MSILEEHHVALPALYGAPAYARPPRIVPEEQRPPDPDDLPLEAFQTVEEREIAAAIGRPAGTVKSRLHRARRLLREQIEHEGDAR